MIRRTLLRQSRTAIAHNSQQCRQPVVPFTQAYLRQSAPPLPRRRIASTWWYSTTAETQQTDAAGGAAPAASPNGTKADSNEIEEVEDPLRRELEVKNREVIDLKDKYLRAVADFRNLQERTKREVHSAHSFAIQRFAKDLIDTVDNLDRALTTVPPEKLVPDGEASSSSGTRDLINLFDGLKMTETILMQTLKKHGLERFDPSTKAEKFDPNLHEATFQTAVEGKEDGTVFHTQQKGFTLNGRVLRAAKVGLVKNS